MPTLNDDVYVGLELIPAGTNADDLPPNKLRHLTNPAIWAGGLPTFPQELTEIVFSGTPADGDTLIWSSEQGMFVTGAGGGGGGFDTTAFLAAAHTWAGKQTFGPSDGIQATISENPYQPGARQLLIGSQDFSGFASELVTSATVASLYLQNNGDAADFFAGVREGLGHSGVQLELNDYAGWTQIAADIDDISAHLAIRGGATQTTPWLDLLLSGEGQSRFRIEPWDAYGSPDPGSRMVFNDGSSDQSFIGDDGYGDVYVESPQSSVHFSIGGSGFGGESAEVSIAMAALRGSNFSHLAMTAQDTAWSFQSRHDTRALHVKEAYSDTTRLRIDQDGPATFYPPDATHAALAIDNSSMVMGDLVSLLAGGQPTNGIHIKSTNVDEDWWYGWVGVDAKAQGNSSLSDGDVSGIVGRAVGTQPDHMVTGLFGSAIYSGTEKHLTPGSAPRHLVAVSSQVANLGPAEKAAALYGSVYAAQALDNAYGLFLASAQGAENITNNYGIYQEDPLAKNFFAGEISVGNSVSDPFLRSLISSDSDWTELHLGLLAWENPYFYSDSDGYAETGVAAKAFFNVQPGVISMDLYKTTTPPSAIAARGRIYVAADGSLHYRGPTTDTQLAPA